MIQKSFLEEKLGDGLTYTDIAALLSCSRTKVSYWATKYGLISTPKKMQPVGTPSISIDCPKKDFNEYALSVTSLGAMCRCLGLAPNGQNYQRVKETAVALCVSLDHFNGRGSTQTGERRRYDCPACGKEFWISRHQKQIDVDRPICCSTSCSNSYVSRWRSRKQKRDTKYCSCCQQHLPFSDFNRDATAKDGLQLHCRECCQKINRKYMDRRRKRQERKRERNRNFIYQYLIQNPCQDCGQSDPVVLTFDHRNPADKIDNISQMMGDGRSLTKIQAEINKCDVVCANCHMKRTSKQFGWWYTKLDNSESIPDSN